MLNVTLESGAVDALCDAIMFCPALSKAILNATSAEPLPVPTESNAFSFGVCRTKNFSINVIPTSSIAALSGQRSVKSLPTNTRSVALLEESRYSGSLKPLCAVIVRNFVPSSSVISEYIFVPYISKSPIDPVAGVVLPNSLGMPSKTVNDFSEVEKSGNNLPVKELESENLLKRP